jgi:uncharacterized membrane protein
MIILFYSTQAVYTEIIKHYGVMVMSRKVIETEGRRWVELGIVSAEQYGQIMRLYSEKKHAIGLIPLLGSILLGLGLISFIAANWHGVPEVLRLTLLLTALIGFYFAGEAFINKDQTRLGIGFIGLGLITFGGGIVLIAQMFHLQAYDVTSWLVWGSVGLMLTYLYRSRYIYLLSFLILSIAQWYSVVEFNQFSYATFVISILGLGYYCWTHKSSLLTWLFSISFIVQSIMLIVNKDWRFLWVFIPILLLYTLGDGLINRSFASPIQSAALGSLYIFALFIVLFVGKGDSFDLYDHLLAKPLPFLTILIVLFAISLFLKFRSNRAVSGFEWILMPGLLYLPVNLDVLYILVLFVFSSFLLWRGYVEEWRFKINLGTLLFLCSTMTAYIKLTWSFMDKSLFFIIGGIILLGLSWLLNRRRNKFFDETKGANDHV